MWYFLLNAAVATWMYFDGVKRQFAVIPWCVGTFIFGPLVTPIYFAKRPLRDGEVREGGTAWNILKNFCFFWTLTFFVAGVAGIANVGSGQQPVTDAEKVGAGLGLVLGMGILFVFWFFPVVGAAILGFFLKKSSVVERGPMGPLANNAVIMNPQTDQQANVVSPPTSAALSANMILKRAQAGAADLASTAKAAVQLATKQAERTKIVQITLPIAYQALGRHLHEQGRMREEFAERAEVIDDQLRQLESLKAAVTRRPAPHGAAEKAQGMALATKEMAKSKTLQFRLNQAFGDLGRAAFEKHAEQSGPDTLVHPILNSRSRVESLDAEIQQIANSYQGQILTPKRLAIAGVIAVLTLPVLLLINRPSTTANSSRLSSSGGATENQENNGPPGMETLPLPIPADQSAFAQIINSSRTRYKTATNDLKKSAVRSERRTTLAKAMPDNRITNWLGTLLEVSTQSDGKAFVAVRLAGSEYVTVQTWNNAFSDIGSQTLIENSSPLYNTLANLSPGDPIIFSGEFLDDDKNHFNERSLTEYGSMTEPAFILRFSKITKGHRSQN